MRPAITAKIATNKISAHNKEIPRRFLLSVSIIRDVEGGAAEYLRLVEDGEGGAKREGLSCGREFSMAVSVERVWGVRVRSWGVNYAWRKFEGMSWINRRSIVI